MSWRVTYSKEPVKSLIAINKESGVIDLEKELKAKGKIELRDTDGTVVRMNPGTEFIIKDGPLGKRPVVYGQAYFANKRGCFKYRTSCWICHSSDTTEIPCLYVSPGNEPNTDELFAIFGSSVIFEFDEKGRSFTICTIDEGEKAIITFSPKARGIRNRYHAKVVKYTEEEYEYILMNFIDNRKWM